MSTRCPTTSTPRHPVTGLALVQPVDCLVSDNDLVTLARADAMFRGHTEAERVRAALSRVGLAHTYIVVWVAC